MDDLLNYPGDADVISALQAAIQAEGHLNLQYRMDWRVVKNLGVKKVAKVLREYGHDTHKWLRYVTDRCLFLGGSTDYEVGRVVEGDSLSGILKAELELEMAVVRPYEQAIQTARVPSEADNAAID